MVLGSFKVEEIKEIIKHNTADQIVVDESNDCKADL
jgi:50S ribosomal subunit-associated GTPase HflX